MLGMESWYRSHRASRKTKTRESYLGQSGETQKSTPIAQKSTPSSPSAFSTSNSSLRPFSFSASTPSSREGSLHGGTTISDARKAHGGTLHSDTMKAHRAAMCRRQHGAGNMSECQHDGRADAGFPSMSWALVGADDFAILIDDVSGSQSEVDPYGCCADPPHPPPLGGYPGESPQALSPRGDVASPEGKTATLNVTLKISLRGDRAERLVPVLAHHEPGKGQRERYNEPTHNRPGKQQPCAGEIPASGESLLSFQNPHFPRYNPRGVSRAELESSSGQQCQGSHNVSCDSHMTAPRAVIPGGRASLARSSSVQHPAVTASGADGASLQTAHVWCPGHGLQAPAGQGTLKRRQPQRSATFQLPTLGDSPAEAADCNDMDNLTASKCINFGESSRICRARDDSGDTLDGLSIIPFATQKEEGPEEVLFALFFQSSPQTPVLPGDQCTRFLFPQHLQRAAKGPTMSAASRQIFLRGRRISFDSKGGASVRQGGRRFNDLVLGGLWKDISDDYGQ